MLKALQAVADRVDPGGDSSMLDSLITEQEAKKAQCSPIIAINNRLQLPEAAMGVLVYAQAHLRLEIKEGWYEKLGQWENALDAHRRKAAQAEAAMREHVAALESSTRYLANDVGPHGVRVNAISAGPIKTVSAMGVGDFGTLLESMAQKAPLRRNVDQADVGNTAAFLLSPLSNGVTGQVIYVDAGYSILGI